MDHLWSPWRYRYVTKADPPGPACIFCAKAEPGNENADLIVFRGGACFGLLNLFPYTNGHLMIAPILHVSRIEDLPEADWIELMRYARLAEKNLREVYQCEGLNLGFMEIPWPVLIFFGVAAVATYVLHFSVFGRHLFAIGGNRDAALYSGVPVKRVECTTYVISAGLAGVAGIAYAAYIGQMSHSVGEAYELYAITAAVLGGCSLRGGEGTILGIFIGAAIIRVMENGINMFKIVTTNAAGQEVIWRLNENWKNIIIGAVILAAVILDQVSHVLKNRKRTTTAQVKSVTPVKPAAG